MTIHTLPIRLGKFTLMAVVATVAVLATSASAAAETREPDAAKAAVKGEVADPAGETYGVVGISNSPEGAGIRAGNANGGPDLVLDGSADGEATTLISESGIDRPSDQAETFFLWNSGPGVLNLTIDGIYSGDGSGLDGVDAATLGGVDAADLVLGLDLATSGLVDVHWDNLTQLPSGLDDGDDDALGDLACAAADVAVWTGSAWECRQPSEAIYSRTLVVGPVGTPQENGSELLAALATLPTPASKEDAWLLRIEAGTYDLGTGGTFEMKSFIDVEGAGEGLTHLVGATCVEFGSASTGVLNGAESSEVRHLTVENRCASDELATAIYNAADDFSLDHVTARTSGAASSNRAISNDGMQVEMDHVTAMSSGGTSSNVGLFHNGDSLAASRTEFSASGGIYAAGILCKGDIELADVAASAVNASSDNMAIDSQSGGCDSRMRNVTATATGGVDSVAILFGSNSIQIIGGHLDADLGLEIGYLQATATLHGVTINATSKGIEAYATHANPSALNLYVNSSSIRGVVATLDLDLEATAFIGGTQLAGGPISGSGTVTCAGVWDETYVHWASTCP